MKKAASKDMKIAMLGYGSQGKALALNLRDSGFDVIIGLKSGSPSRRRARKDGFSRISTFAKATRAADCVCFAFPDHLHGRVYAKDIRENVRPGSALWFLHGLSIHFQFVQPPAESDVILIAPHAPGIAVREKFLADKSISAFYAIYQNRTGQAKKLAMALAEASGFARKRLIATSFEDEALGDLFGEQAVLCGGLAALIKNGFEVLVANGLPAEHAYLEVAYQLDLIVQLLKQHGIEGMLKRISVAARFGSVKSGQKIIDRTVRKSMDQVYSEIASGRFPKQLNRLTPKEIAKLDGQLSKLTHPDLERAARKFAGKK